MHQLPLNFHENKTIKVSSVLKIQTVDICFIGITQVFFTCNNDADIMNPECCVGLKVFDCGNDEELQGPDNERGTGRL